MWDLPGLGIKPVSPALAGRFLTTGPPGKSWCFVLVFWVFCHSKVKVIDLSWDVFSGSHKKKKKKILQKA